MWCYYGLKSALHDHISQVLLLYALSATPDSSIVDVLHLRDLNESETGHVVVQSLSLGDSKAHLMNDRINFGVVFDLVLSLEINRSISWRAFFDTDGLIAGKILLLNVPQGVTVASKADSQQFTFTVLTSQIVQVVPDVVTEEADYFGSEHQELMETHITRWAKVKDPQDDLHILTFDIIYCSIVYRFYEFENYTKIIRKSKSDLEHERLASEIDGKRNELDALEAELAKAQAELDELPEIMLEGQTVKHRMFGKGLVVKQSGTYIEVAFASKMSKFILTTAFTGGFLSSEDETVLEGCKRIESAIAYSEKLSKAVKVKQAELSLLIAKMK